MYSLITKCYFLFFLLWLLLTIFVLFHSYNNNSENKCFLILFSFNFTRLFSVKVHDGTCNKLYLHVP